MIFTERINKAIQVATEAHDGHVRKGTNIPYTSHLFAVMMITGAVTNNEDTLIASLLHDILEDVPDKYSREDMKRDFGPKVLAIVEGVTKDSSLDSWEDRSNAYLDHLRHHALRESVIVSGADKYHNLYSILQDYRQLGDGLWSRFNSGKDRQIWWYESVGEILRERIPEKELVYSYDSLLSQLKAEASV